MSATVLRWSVLTTARLRSMMEIMRCNLRSSFSCSVRLDQEVLGMRRKAGGFGGGLGDEAAMIRSSGIGSRDVEMWERSFNGLFKRV